MDMDMNKNKTMQNYLKHASALLVVCSSSLLVACGDSDNNDTAPPPAAKYHDQNAIDPLNNRAFGQAYLINDLVMSEDNAISSELRFKLYTYQMILAECEYLQARGAYQLALSGVSIEEIQALWAPDYVSSLEDLAEISVFNFANQAGRLPGSVNALTHKDLRTYFTDRQIVDLFHLMAAGASEVIHSELVGVVMDQETLDWATENLADVGWQPGRYTGPVEQQRPMPMVGDALEQARAEFLQVFNPNDLFTPVQLATDWLSASTGIDVPAQHIDTDQDGVADNFDAFASEPAEWSDDDNDGIGKNADADDDNDGISDLEEQLAGTSPNSPDTDNDGIDDPFDDSPLDGLPVFDASQFDWQYYSGYTSPGEAESAYWDRQMLSMLWSKKAGYVLMAMDPHGFYDGALPAGFQWRTFMVQSLAGGCIHCQAHGAFGMHLGGYSLEEIQGMLDFERYEKLTNADLAVLRLARDAATLPSRITPAHIEELRRYYSQAEIHQIFTLLTEGAFLSSYQQSLKYVTDELSMSWTIANLSDAGWAPGWAVSDDPQEQAPYHMVEMEGAMMAAGMAAEQSGQPFDPLSVLTGQPIPPGNDSDADGIEDAYDGYPDDATRWADFDGDGIENHLDEDIDGDGLSNEQELELGTSLVRADSDADGIDDAQELTLGSDPWVKDLP